MFHYTGAGVVKFSFIAILIFLCLGGKQPAFAQAASEDVSSRLAKAESLKEHGDFDAAKQIYGSLLPELRPRGASAELAEVLNNLSAFADDAGQYAEAAALAGESINVCSRLKDTKCEAKARNELGQARSNAGQYAEAALELEQAVKLSTDAGDVADRVVILNNLGNVFYYQAKYSEAFRAYEEAEQASQQSRDTWAVLWRKLSRLNLATLYQRLGNDQRAIAIYHEVLDAPQALSPREIAHVLANLGILYRRLNDSEAALRNYHDAEKWYAQQKDVDGEIGVLKNIGIVLGLDLGRLANALQTFDRAHALAEKSGNQREVMQTLLYRGETLYRMGRFTEAAHDYKTAQHYAVQLGTGEEEWKALYGLGKIDLSTGHGDLAFDKLRQAVDRIEQLRSKLQLARLKTDFLADKRDVYDALIALLVERNDVAGALEYMERSRSRVFQDRFFAGQSGTAPLKIPTIQSRLPADAALIEFWVAQDGIAAVWITSHSTGIAKKSFSAAEMEQLIKTLSGFPDSLGTDWRAAMAKVSASLPPNVAPLNNGESRHLMIVPDGFLSQLPFELLPDTSGKLVVEDHDVTYMPSAVLLLRGSVGNKRAWRFPWQEQLVAFGDPTITGTGESSVLASRTAGTEQISALPASGEEIRSIAGMSSGRSRLYMNDSDRKSVFFQSAKSASLLHVSTHATADLDNPERSRLLFSPDEPGQANSFVFLKELYELDLRGVSLATLSACDTERGRLIPGEGAQAFSRALLAAGSRSTLTSLWRVPDQPTSDFMKHFYFYLLKKHKSKAEALRFAKLDFFHSGTELSDPRLWAAFVLNGGGLEEVPRFISWLVLLSPLLLLAAGAGFAATRRRKVRSGSVGEELLHANR